MILIQITQDGRTAVLNPQRIAQGTDSESIVLLSPFPARCPVLMGWIMPDQVPLTAEDAPEGANGNYYPMVNVIPTPDFGVSANSVLSVWVYKPTKAYTAQAGTANACFLVQQQKDDGSGGYQYDNMTTNPVEIEITETILPAIPDNPTTSMWEDVIAAITYYNEHVAKLDDAVEDVQEELANGITAVHDTEGEVQRDVYTDSAPTDGSQNIVTSGGVFNAIGSALDTAEGYADGVAANAENNAKDYTDEKIAQIPVGGGQTTVYGPNNVAQTEVHTDNAPTLNSQNLVTSGGVKQAIADAQFEGEGTHVYEDGVGASRLDIPKIYNSIDEVISGATASNTMSQLIAAMSDNGVLSAKTTYGEATGSGQPVYKKIIPSGANGIDGVLNIFKKTTNGQRSVMAQYVEKTDYAWDGTDDYVENPYFAVCHGKMYICPTDGTTNDTITVKDIGSGTETTLALSESDSVYWYRVYSFKGVNPNRGGSSYGVDQGVIVFGISTDASETLYYACVKDGSITATCTQVSTDYTVGASNSIIAIAPGFALVYQRTQGVVVMIDPTGTRKDITLGLTGMDQMVVQEGTYASPLYLYFADFVGGSGKIYSAYVHFFQPDAHRYSEIGTSAANVVFYSLLGGTSTRIYYSANAGTIVYAMDKTSGTSTLVGIIPQSVGTILSYDVDKDIWTTRVGVYSRITSINSNTKPSVYIGTSGSTSPSFYGLIRGTGSDANKMYWNEGSYILVSDAPVRTYSGAIDQSGAFTWQSLDSAEVDTSEIEEKIDEVAASVAGKLNSWGDIPEENVLPEGIDLATVTVGNGYKKGWYKASCAINGDYYDKYVARGYPHTSWFRPDPEDAGTVEFLIFVSEYIEIAITYPGLTNYTWQMRTNETSVGGGTATWGLAIFYGPFIFLSPAYGTWTKVQLDGDIFGTDSDDQGIQGRLLKTSRMAENEVIKQKFAPSMELFQKSTPTRVYKFYTEIVSSGTKTLNEIVNLMESNSIALISLTNNQRAALNLTYNGGSNPVWGDNPFLQIFKVGTLRAIAYFSDSKNLLASHYVRPSPGVYELSPWQDLQHRKFLHKVSLHHAIDAYTNAYIQFSFISSDIGYTINDKQLLFSAVAGAEFLGVFGRVEDASGSTTLTCPVVNASPDANVGTIYYSYIRSGFVNRNETITYSSSTLSFTDTVIAL